MLSSRPGAFVVVCFLFCVELVCSACRFCLGMHARRRAQHSCRLLLLASWGRLSLSVLECSGSWYAWHSMKMEVPGLADSLQRCLCENRGICAVNGLDTDPGWQQSKLIWALSAEVGQASRMRCTCLWHAEAARQPFVCVQQSKAGGWQQGHLQIWSQTQAGNRAS